MLTTCLAVAFPLLSYTLLKAQVLPTYWLGLPDGLLAIGLLMGLGVQASPGIRWGLAMITLAVFLWGFVLNPQLGLSIMPAVVNLLLARLFQMTLENGSEPLISRIARIARREGPLPDELATYTRRLTAAWAVFFLALAVNSLLLAAFATIETVMLFANTLNMIFIGLFFVMENLYRGFRYHHYSHTPLRQLIGTIAVHGWQANHEEARPQAPSPGLSEQTDS
jgi:uncharacterized membrane protein